MSRVTEGRMEEGQEGRSSARSDEPEARSGVLGMTFEIGGGSPVLGP
jgi:hypothetical protein